MAATHDDLTGRLKFTGMTPFHPLGIGSVTSDCKNWQIYLSIKVVAAKDLTAKSGGTASPFVIVKWGKQEDKTSVKKNVRTPYQ